MIAGELTTGGLTRRFALRLWPAERHGRTLSLAQTAEFWRTTDRCPPGPEDTRPASFSGPNGWVIPGTRRPFR